ncbi:hypothetical protein GH714_000871 [Hevea brasiliensis]|uniref:EGF-like domain-containing protein n=1 Tax=Hevea brasiliensis TaxID=3981 RepID=A0A6A6L5L9_HEVBR|nr:hypothetical protein GH714_000871 [Hevea brasiliensis]
MTARKGLYFEKKDLRNLPNSCFGASFNYASTRSTGNSSRQAHNCPQRCGNVSIPYPFGIKGCCRNEDFLITCKKIVSNSPQPQPFLGNTGIEVTNINITLGELKINNNVSKYCYNIDYSSTGDYQTTTSTLTLSNFTVSRSRNKFTVVGCDSYAYLQGFRRKEHYSAGCMSTCDSLHSVYDKSCAGSGCCQIQIPDGLYSANVTAYRFNKRENVSNFNPCTYAFIVEDGKFNFSSQYVKKIPQDKFPMVLEWSVHDYTNQEAREGISSACGLNASSYQPDSVPGYRCKCNEGYDGNPYLGCQGVSTGFLVLLVAISWIFLLLRKRRLQELKEKFFQKNGGLILQQKLSMQQGIPDIFKIFTAEELKEATNKL